MDRSKQTPLLERYQRLLELSRDLASTLDHQTLLNRIVHAAADLCQAEAASILLYNEANRELYFEAASNLESPDMKGLVVPVEASIAGWILTEQQPAIIDDTSKDPRHFNQIEKDTEIETVSLLGVPLFTKDKVVGVLEVINKLFGQFSEDDQELLMALGAHAAVAIENARLFQQSDLIAEFVHELRTPLTSLNAATHLLTRPELSAEQNHTILQTMLREINRLSEMTSSFLDLARMESGRTRFSVKSISINELLEECVAVIRGKLDEKGQNLDMNLQKEIPPISADYDKLKQVMLNLLNNATKYTPSGGTITLAAKSTPDSATIIVRDSGIGIPPESQPYIFDKFYRVPGSEQVDQGTGLGLSICQRIVEAHQGKIEVDSQFGTGSTFTIYLPLIKVDGNTSGESPHS